MFETALGVRPADLARAFGMMSIPLVDAKARFLAPARFNDAVEIASEVSEFRRSSFDVQHRLSIDGRLAAEGSESTGLGRPGSRGSLEAQEHSDPGGRHRAVSRGWRPLAGAEPGVARRGRSVQQARVKWVPLCRRSGVRWRLGHSARRMAGWAPDTASKRFIESLGLPPRLGRFGSRWGEGCCSHRESSRGAIPFRDARTPVMNTIASISISPRIRVRVAIRGVVQMEASGKIETLRILNSAKSQPAP